MEKKIIEFLKNNKILYDKSYRSYKYNTEKEIKWQELATELNTSGNLTVKIIKKRWKTLRDKYYREKKSELTCSVDGSKGSARWKYYHLLHFLSYSKQCSRPVPNYNQPLECKTVIQTIPENFNNIGNIIIKDVSNESSLMSNSSCSSSNLLLSALKKYENSKESLPKNRKQQNFQEKNLIRNKCEVINFLITRAKESLPVVTSTKAFFSSLALQVEEAKLPFHRLSDLQLKIMNVVHEEIKLSQSRRN